MVAKLNRMGWVVALCGLLAPAAWAQSRDHGGGFVEHGVAAPVSRSHGAVGVWNGEGQPRLAVWLQDDRGCYGLTMIDPATGASTFYPLPFETPDAPFAFLLSRDGIYYSLFGHRFVAFDPAKADYIHVVEVEAYLAMWMTEDDDGVVWAGSYPDARVSSYDPRTRTYRDHGPVNEENWKQYPRAVAVDDAGWVYAGIGFTNVAIVALDPRTGETRPMVDDAARAPGTPVVWRGEDGRCYARMPGDASPWLRLHEGRATTLQGEPGAAKAKEVSGHQGVEFGELPGGGKVEQLNIPGRWMRVVDAQGQSRRVTFDYPSEGASIYGLELGPDGRVYGSTGHPLHLFAYDAAADAFWDVGLPQGGHINAFVTLEGKVYGGIYPRGVLIEYDPGRAATADRPNPRDVTRGGTTVLRPHAMLAKSDGRHVVMTGTPGYGKTGGGMLVYDAGTGEATLTEHTQLIENQSTKALAELPDGSLIGGTSTAPGTGGEKIATQCELYILDWPSRNVVYREAILPGVQEIRELTVMDDGRVYGLASDGTFFVFDPASRRLVHTESLSEVYGKMTGGQAPRVWAVGEDGALYTLFRRAIVRIEPGTFAHRKLADTPVEVEVGVVLEDGRLYFASGPRLWSYRLPGRIE